MALMLGRKMDLTMALMLGKQKVQTRAALKVPSWVPHLVQMTADSLVPKMVH